RLQVAPGLDRRLPADSRPRRPRVALPEEVFGLSQEGLRVFEPSPSGPEMQNAPLCRGVFLFARHCEEHLRRSNPFFLYAARWIASRSLSSGAHSRDPLARNDESLPVPPARPEPLPHMLRRRRHHAHRLLVP